MARSESSVPCSPTKIDYLLMHELAGGVREGTRVSHGLQRVYQATSLAPTNHIFPSASHMSHPELDTVPNREGGKKSKGLETRGVRPEWVNDGEKRKENQKSQLSVPLPPSPSVFTPSLG